MKKPRRFLVSVSAFVVLLGILALPGVHWRLIGWAKSEKLWRGRPTSYYSTRIANSFFVHERDSDIRPRWTTVNEVWVRKHLSDGLGDIVWGGPPPFADDSDERPDVDALPVLIALMSDENVQVRQYAVKQTAVLGRDAAPAMETFIALLSDENNWVRLYAAFGLAGIGPQARKAVPALLRVASKYPGSRYSVYSALLRIDPVAADTVRPPP